MITSLFTVPVSVVAKTRDELTVAMLKVQSRLRMQVVFHDFNFIKGEWIAWYDVDMKSQMIKADNE